MDDIYYWTGFVVFWLFASGIFVSIATWIVLDVYDHFAGQIKFTRNDGIFFFGWRINSAFGKQVYLANLRRQCAFHHHFPSSREKLAREWYYNVRIGRYAVSLFGPSLFGVEIFWVYRFHPCWPWQVRNQRARWKCDPVTWLEPVPNSGVRSHETEPAEITN